MIELRRADERGHANHGWLDSYHTFSFASYHDPKFAGFGQLRVINEDRVKGGQGFGEHPHKNFEIFSYIVSGALRHNDSMGNEEILKRGEVQFTSAGKGLSHSEFNASNTETVHFLQMWIKPDKDGLEPAYSTKKYSDEVKRNKLVCIVAKKNEADQLGAIAINQDSNVYATLLDNDATVVHKVAPERRLYVHVIQTGGSIRIKAQNGAEAVLNEGDGAFVDGASELSLTGNTAVSKKQSEVLLFDLA